MNEKNETLPQVVMPDCSEMKMLKGQKALVTGANSVSEKVLLSNLQKPVRM